MSREQLLHHAANARQLAERHRIIARVSKVRDPEEHKRTAEQWDRAAEDLERKAANTPVRLPRVANGMGW